MLKPKGLGGPPAGGGSVSAVVVAIVGGKEAGRHKGRYAAPPCEETVYLIGESDFDQARTPPVGVLLANLGTPEAPTPDALRRYLRQFLGDPRVVELPRPLWWVILHLFVLTTRSRRSARLYRRIWTTEGSPLLTISRRQAAALESVLRQRIGSPLRVALGMRYGSPSLSAGLADLRSVGCRRLLLLPLYPQYSSATTGSTCAAVFADLSRWRWIPELRTVTSYHDHPGYLAALAASIREVWTAHGQPERLLISFHGIPQRASVAGDPYFCHCQKTARLLVDTLGLPPSRATVAFQSRLGRQRWLEPYTDVTLQRWGRDGLASVDVVCPGFAADCLETLEEIAETNREVFQHAGGGRFRYLPALNDRADHIAALAQLCWEHLQGWVVPREEWKGEEAAQRATATNQRAATMTVGWGEDT